MITRCFNLSAPSAVGVKRAFPSFIISSPGGSLRLVSGEGVLYSCKTRGADNSGKDYMGLLIVGPFGLIRVLSRPAAVVMAEAGEWTPPSRARRSPVDARTGVRLTNRRRDQAREPL